MLQIRLTVAICLLHVVLVASYLSISILRVAETSITAQRGLNPRLQPLKSSNRITTDDETLAANDSDKQSVEPLRPKVHWNAAASSSVRVKESKRTVEQYMALPASEYSVLTAEQITRISDSEFKCTLGTMNFFGTKLTPTLYVDVNVFPDDARAEIAVSRAEVSGSETTDAINGAFSISAINVVTAGVDKKGFKTLNSNTTLSIDATVPSTRLPIGLIRRGGNFLMQSTLSVVVPTFVRILAADFKRWSAGDDSRDAVQGARLDVGVEDFSED